jgi:hypothetical protein
MKKYLYLHIGAPKTGTTAIQKFLWINRLSIAEDDYLYPESPQVHFGHPMLAWTLTPTKHRHKREEVWRNVMKEIGESSCSNVVVSSELFFSRSKRIDFTFLSSALRNFNLTIVLYLRRQDQWLQSAYAESIQSFKRRNTGSIEQWMIEKAQEKGNYYDKVGLWKSVFPDATLIIRPFEKEQLRGGLIEDFLSHIGLSMKNNYNIPEKRVNPSLDYMTLTFLRCMNELDLTQHEHAQMKNALRDISAKLRGAHYFRELGLLSPAERFEVLERFESSNSKLAKEYLNRKDGKLFYEDWPDPSKNTVNPQTISMEDLCRIMGLLFLKMDSRRIPASSNKRGSSGFILSKSRLRNMRSKIAKKLRRT